MSEKSARGGAARGKGRGRGTRGGTGRNPGESVAPGAGANPQFTTDQVVAMVKALSTSQTSLGAAIETEEQFEEEEEEEEVGNTKKGGGKKGRKQSKQEEKPPAKISAKEGRIIRELVSILFDKSGDVPIVKLQQEAKKVSNRQEYQDPGKLATFLQKHDFFQTRLNKDGVMLVKVKRDVTLCGKYTASTCKEDGCAHFHLCRQYASGQGCSNGLSCRYSHNLKDDHNIVVLQENFLDGLAEAQVLSMITKPEKSKGGSKPAKKAKKDEGTTPTDVPPSTTSKGGSKPAKKPKKDEGTTPTEVPPPMTSKGGSKPAKKPKKMKDEGTPPTDVPQPMTRQEELKRLPRVCHFYTTEGKSCKNGPACTAGLHVCTFYLTGSCSRKPCQLSHNLSDPQPRDLLKKSGLVGKPGKYIVGLYKEKFEAKKKEKQEKKDQQAPLTEDSSKSDPGMPEPGAEPSTESTHDDVTTMPEHWEPMGSPEGGFMPLENGFVLAEIPPTGKEMRDIMSAFYQTLHSSKVHSIKRVQNFYLWDMYCKRKNQMKRQNNDQFPLELRLFHGTNQEAVSPICRQNFDWRLSGHNVGQLFGQGSYFTANASYASAYSQPSYPTGHRYMFFAKVLVGRYAKGESSYRRPPPLNEYDPYGLSYDSCVDDVNSPNVFVVFESTQCYPEYLIEYSY